MLINYGKTVETWVNKGMFHVSNLFEYWEFGNLLMKNQNRKIMENPCALISYVCFYDSKKKEKTRKRKNIYII